MPYNDSKGPKMESAKQERKDLLRDNPVVRDMDSSRPWMSKHFKSSMSPLKDMHGSPAEKELSAKQEAAFGGGKNPGLEAAIEAAPEMREGMHMNYDSGINNNHPDMLGEMGKAAGEAGAKVLKDKPKGNMQRFITEIGKNAAKEANEESQQSLAEGANEEKNKNAKPLTKGGK